MRNLLLFILILTPFGSIAEEQYGSFSAPDGKMWEAWTKSIAGEGHLFMKAAYVQGVISGLSAGSLAGYYSGRTDEKRDALEYLKPCLEKGPCSGIPAATLVRPITESTADEIHAGATTVQAQFILQNASILDVVDHVDKFYADRQNTSVCMVTAVEDAIASINGNPPSEEHLNIERRECN